MQLRDYVRFNSDFRDSVNLYLDLNKVDKIKSYIPTKSSVDILEQYLDAVLDNKQHSTLLIGPYGKGKSHLLLMLLAALTLKNNASNDALMDELCDKIKRVSGEVQKKVSKAYKQGKYLPVLIMSTQGDLNQAFLVGLNEALKREKLTGITPDTFYTYAVSTINRWKKSYPDTYANFSEMLKEYKYTVIDEKLTIACLADKHQISATNLKKYFKEIYGLSIYAYLKEKRIQKAAELLRETNHEIGKIAGMVGYDNASKFSNSFKSIMGINPSEYKKSV